MTTNLKYLEDTYVFTDTATVVGKGRGEKGGYLELDQSIFYPQGGGQPSDAGYIVLGETEIPVTFVGFSDGIVQHFVPEAYFETAKQGASVSLKVNEARRLNNAKLHSSGHLISHVMETMKPGLVPIKGYHFENGAHVEFIDQSRVGSAEMIEEANGAIESDIQADLKISAVFSDFDSVNKIRPDLAPFIPRDKPTRVVQIGGYKALPCGGTHVKSLAELSGMKITKIKRKKDNLKVSYEL